LLSAIRVPCFRLMDAESFWKTRTVREAMSQGYTFLRLTCRCGKESRRFPRCDGELMQWMVLWEVSTGLSMWKAAPAMGDRGLGDCRGQAFPLAKLLGPAPVQNLAGTTSSDVSQLRTFRPAPS
jgi:hypothetical protein